VKRIAAAPSGVRAPALRLRSLAFLAVWGFAAIPVLAQSGGPSVSSDSVPQTRTIPEREEVEKDLDRARFRLGPVRILPAFYVSNAGYDSNVFASAEDPVADWTATVKAGARFLVPFGSKVVLRADGFPAYTWYHELKDRDHFGGQYDGSLFGFFNRMTTELAVSYSESYRIYSSEIDSPVFTTAKSGLGRFELELGSHWSVFGLGEIADVNYNQIQGPPSQEIGVPRNNRTQWGGQGGLRYRISTDWSVAGMGEKTWTDFDLTPELRNNTSTAYLASVGFSRPRFFLNLVGGYREGRGSDSEFFKDYSTGVGSFFVSYFPIYWLEISGSGHRTVTYSSSLLNIYYFENRLGGKVNIQVHPRILVSGGGYFGPNNYPRAEPVPEVGLVKRRDEIAIYGGGVSMLLWTPLVLSAQVRHTTHDSNIPSNNTSYTRYTVFFSFSGVLER
jgi:hypothetical protein